METCHPKKIDLGLDRIRQVAQKLSLESTSASVVTVAGTNGKGSFVHALSALLIQGGANVGAYTSPHILTYNERICINHVPVTDVQLCMAFHDIDRARGEISLTYFEFSTLAALYLFSQSNLDVIILEVGLGGRLDSVNIIDPDISVITSIALDHEQWLGSDRETIAAEKAGILRTNKPFISVVDDSPRSLAEISTALNCRVYALDECLKYTEMHLDHAKRDVRPLALTVVDSEGEAHEVFLKNHRLPAPSLLAALQCYCLLSERVSLEHAGEILSSLTLPGRFERSVWRGRPLVFDVAHNPQAATNLAVNLAFAQESYVCLLAAMRDKDLEGMVFPLVPHVCSWICTEINSMARSSPVKMLEDSLQQAIKRRSTKFESSENGESIVQKPPNVIAEPVLKNAVERALLLSKQERCPLLIVGSFYLIGEIKAMMNAENEMLL